jgi:hypothetical protein
MKTFIKTVIVFIALIFAASAYAECKDTHTLTYPDGTQVTYCLDE